jgi:hypothetical protein
MTAASATPAKRPTWVWIISILMFVSALYGMLSLYLVKSGAFPLTPEQSNYFDNLSALDYGLSIAGGLINLTGAAMLFFMRKAAVPLFGAAFGLGILGNIYNIAFRDLIAVIGVPGLIGALVGLAISGAIFFYARHLKGRGMLA